MYNRFNEYPQVFRYGGVASGCLALYADTQPGRSRLIEGYIKRQHLFVSGLCYVLVDSFWLQITNVMILGPYADNS